MATAIISIHAVAKLWRGESVNVSGAAINNASYYDNKSVRTRNGDDNKVWANLATAKW